MSFDLERRWREHAACAGMDVEIFFPPQSQVKDEEEEVSPRLQGKWDEAKRICHACPVRNRCASDYLGEPEGVWGGLDPRERKRLRRVRSRHVQGLPDNSKSRSQYGRLVHDLHINSHLDFKAVARLLGISVQVVHELYAWHLDRMKAEEERSAKVVELPIEEEEEEIIWPSSPPRDGDTWVRYHGRVACAHYRGETEDASWYHLKITHEGGSSNAWFKARDVRTFNTGKTILHRQGETSRVYGTRLSEGNRRRAG